MFVDLDDPSLLVLPSSTAKEGESITLSCIVVGTEPITYSWYKDDKKVIGEDLSVYVLNKVSRTEEGVYKCIVTNNLGKKSTSEEIINVNCKFFCFRELAVLKKCSNNTAQKMKFSLRISSVNVTKSAGNCRFGQIY